MMEHRRSSCWHRALVGVSCPAIGVRNARATDLPVGHNYRPRTPVQGAPVYRLCAILIQEDQNMGVIGVPDAAVLPRVILVDRCPAVREGLALRLEQDRGFQVSGEASDVPSASQLVDAIQPD